MSILVEFYKGNTNVDTLIVKAKPDNSSNIEDKLLGDNVATIGFILNGLYNFSIGDYATILGNVYYITEAPVIVKYDSYKYQYAVKMETVQHKLRNAKYLFMDGENQLTVTDFALTGTATDFINLLIQNANRITGMNWQKGGVVTTGYKNLSFANEDCLGVLAKLAETFETEFYTEGQYIHLAKKQRLTGRTFTYGRNRGFKSIHQQLASATLFTRLYVYGSANNLPVTYRNFATRLSMNSLDPCLIKDLSCKVEEDDPLIHYTFNFNLPTTATITGLVIQYRAFDTADAWTDLAGAMESPRTVDLPLADYEFRFTTEGGVCNDLTTAVIHPTSLTNDRIFFQDKSIIEKNIDKYGIIEGALVIEDIQPEREGVVTAGDVSNVYKFKDVSLEFNLNDYLLPGITPKVVFNTGQLSGYTFEIANYNNSTKEFTILQNKEETALELPSNAFKPAIGDKYILIDILLPRNYIDAAERKLRAKATEYLDKVSEPDYKYTVDCDAKYLREQNIEFKTGDIINVYDMQLAINQAIRILSVRRSLLDEYDYDIDLGDTISQSVITQLQASVSQNSQQINSTASQINNSQLFNGTWIGHLKINQGTIIAKDMPTAADTAGMKQVYADADGKLWKAP